MKKKIIELPELKWDQSKWFFFYSFFFLFPFLQQLFYFFDNRTEKKKRLATIQTHPFILPIVFATVINILFTASAAYWIDCKKKNPENF